MAVNNRKNLRYNVFNPDQLGGIYQSPIVDENRAPTTADLSDIGTVWIDQSADAAYILTSVAAGAGNWENLVDIPSAGTDGQVWIGATGAAAAWANITSTGGSVTITNGANTINLEAAGVAALTSLDGDAGTATPVAGVITIAGGTNITTAGAAGTLTVNLDASPSVAGSLTAGVDLNMTSGDCTITADTDGAQTIYLHANGGTSETIDIHSDQGTGVASVYVHSDVGGLTFASGLASADAINITASNAAGGIDVDCGTGGLICTATNGEIRLASGTGAVNIGADAAAHTVTVGSTTTTAATVVQSGTGDLVLTSTDAVTVDAAGVLELNSSAGVIGIGNDAVAQNINIGTGAAARTITIGNGTAATAIDLNCGTGDITVGTNATAHTVTVGSTNTTSNAIIQSGTGGIAVNSGGVIDVDAVGALSLNSSTGVINMGNDVVAQNINIGTGAAARTITVGNATGASQVDINCGTGGVSVGTSANAHTTTIGSVNTTSDTTIQAGTSGIAIDSAGLISIDAGGTIAINSDAAAISIGDDADAFAINIGTGAAARTITMGNATGATSVVINAGTGDVLIGTNAIAHTTTVGSVTGAADTNIYAGTGALTIDGLGAIDIDAATTIGINSDGGAINIGTDADAQAVNVGTGAAARPVTVGSTNTTSATTIQSGTGGISLEAAGIVDMVPATASVAGVGLTIDANVGVGTFTGLTTASAASQVFTITNSVCTVGSAILVSASNLGANDAQMTVTRVTPGAGSFTVTLTNNGAAALNGDVIITFWIIAA